MAEFFKRSRMGDGMEPDIEIFIDIYGEGDGNMNTRERAMRRTKTTYLWSTCERSYYKWQSADTMKDKELVRRWAIATIKNTSKHCTKIDAKSKKPRMRTDQEMSDEALLGSEYEMSAKLGLKRKSGNKAAAAKWLSDNYGWNSPIEHNIHGDEPSLDNTRFIFKGYKDKRDVDHD